MQSLGLLMAAYSLRQRQGAEMSPTYLPMPLALIYLQMSNLTALLNCLEGNPMEKTEICTNLM